MCRPCFRPKVSPHVCVYARARLSKILYKVIGWCRRRRRFKARRYKVVAAAAAAASRARGINTGRASTLLPFGRRRRVEKRGRARTPNAIGERRYTRGCRRSRRPAAGDRARKTAPRRKLPGIVAARTQTPLLSLV